MHTKLCLYDDSQCTREIHKYNILTGKETKMNGVTRLRLPSCENIMQSYVYITGTEL